jgi:hypothetical protein
MSGGGRRAVRVRVRVQAVARMHAYGDGACDIL